MRARSKVLTSRFYNVFELSPDRFKNPEVAKKALDNLVAYSYAFLDYDNQYYITELGKTIPYAIAEYRKSQINNSKDD